MHLVEIQAFNVWGFAIRNSLGSPEMKALYEEISTPALGDLVLEVTSLHAAWAKGQRLGRLRRIEQEPMRGSDDPDCNVFGMKEPAYYIELPDGREFRWTNARFIKVIERLLS